MLETRAVVISLHGKEALVEAEQGGGCGNCSSENGCSSGKLSQLFCREPRRFRVLNEGNATVGAQVQITVAEGVLLRSAMLMYLLPLVLLFVGAALGSWWGGEGLEGDTYAAVGGLSGLFAGFLLVRLLSVRRRLSSVAQPLIASTPV